MALGHSGDSHASYHSHQRRSVWTLHPTVLPPPHTRASFNPSPPTTPTIPTDPTAPFTPTLIPTPSLHSFCLSSLSSNFHLFTPSTLASLPAVLARRVVARICADRGWSVSDLIEGKAGAGGDGQLGGGGGLVVTWEEDEATLWAFCLLSDLLSPSTHSHSAPTSPHLALLTDPSSVLPHLTPRALAHSEGSKWYHTTIEADWQHPLVSLPRLYNSNLGDTHRFELLTSLVLSHSPPRSITSSNSSSRASKTSGIDDKSIQNLRYCTHLTVLWTEGSALSDAGIRLLSASLSPPASTTTPTFTRPDDLSSSPTRCGALPNASTADPESARGPWRLRAWYLRDSLNVSDISLRAFVKWPGLVLLDLRGTSCTEHARGILQRAMKGAKESEIGDSGWRHATEENERLFDSLEDVGTVDSVVSNLHHLLLVDRNSTQTQPSQPSTAFHALHIVPTDLPLPSRPAGPPGRLGSHGPPLPRIMSPLSFSPEPETGSGIDTSSDADSRSRAFAQMGDSRKDRQGGRVEVSTLSMKERRLMLTRRVTAGWDNPQPMIPTAASASSSSESTASLTAVDVGKNDHHPVHLPNLHPQLGQKPNPYPNDSVRVKRAKMDPTTGLNALFATSTTKLRPAPAPVSEPPPAFASGSGEGRTFGNGTKIGLDPPGVGQGMGKVTRKSAAIAPKSSIISPTPTEAAKSGIMNPFRPKAKDPSLF